MYARTCAALALAAFSQDEVVSGQWVTVDTMGFACIQCILAVTAKNICRVGDGFKMIRIDAPWITTEMVNLQSFRNWSHKDRVGDAVCSKHRLLAVAPNGEFPVSTASTGSPFPTTRRLIGDLNVRPKTIFLFRGKCGDRLGTHFRLQS